MAELAELRVGGHPVATYVDGTDLDEVLAPRPHLHPVRTLRGRPVTDAVPADHRWHLGVSVAVQDVAGTNFWGGRTYLRDRGYTWRADHGRIVHAGFDALDPSGVLERLDWTAPDGQVLLSERRTLRAAEVAGGWELELRTELRNATDRPLPLGSPATNGRTGAGYGGLFWRLPPAHSPQVRIGGSAAGGAPEPDAVGEEAVHGRVRPWLMWTERGPDPFTLVATGADDATLADPWFVRVDGYPGFGSQLAAVHPVVVAPAAAITRGLFILVADGVLDRDSAVRWWRMRHPDDAAVAYPPP